MLLGGTARPPQSPPAPVRGRRRPRSGRRRLQSGRQWIIASSYCSCLATRHSSTLLSASLFSAILNRRGGWLPTLAGFTLGAIAEPLLVPCWVPLPLLGAIGGCHAHARVPLPGCHAMGAIGGVPSLGAIVRAMAGCHCSVPLPHASYQL